MSALGRSLFIFQRRSVKELLERIAQTESRRWPLLRWPPLWPRLTRSGLHLISVVEFIWHRMKLCNPFLIQSVSVIAWNLPLGVSCFSSSRLQRSIPIWSDKLWNCLTQRPVTINQISCQMWGIMPRDMLMLSGDNTRFIYFLSPSLCCCCLTLYGLGPDGLEIPCKPWLSKGSRESGIGKLGTEISQRQSHC